MTGTAFDTKTLFELLPAVLRLRDHEDGEALMAELGVIGDDPADFGALKGLVSVLGEIFGALEEDLAQFRDDHHIETCAEWAVPYIGDLIRADIVSDIPGAGLAPARAQVADTIALRRRKGTIAVVEHLAWAVTGRRANAWEAYQRMLATQHLADIRLDRGQTLTLRSAHALERLGGSFDPFAHTLEVRRVGSARGRYNLPNIPVFLWEITAEPHEWATPAREGGRRFRFSPLGADLPLHHNPSPKPHIGERTSRDHAPAPVTRRDLLSEDGAPPVGPEDDERRYYGVDASFAVRVDGTLVPAALVQCCDLSDHAGAWAHGPDPKRLRIDPQLGRFILPDNLDPDGLVEVLYHYGAAAPIGGGAYERAGSAGPEPSDAHALLTAETLDDGLTAIGGNGFIRIDSNHTLDGPAAISPDQSARITLAAANGLFPQVRLAADLDLNGAGDGEIVISGLRFWGGALRIGAGLKTVILRDCTLTPGLSLEADGAPQSPGSPSLIITGDGVELILERCILGPIQADGAKTVRIEATECVIDAGDPGVWAISDAPNAFDGVLSLESCTVRGRVAAEAFGEISNTLFLAEPVGGVSVKAVRKQVGCVRFSYLPEEADAPRPYRCVDATAHPGLIFHSRRYGDPRYLLPDGRRTPLALMAGAEDESEIGVYRRLGRVQAARNLRLRLEEYVRFGMEAGVFIAG